MVADCVMTVCYYYYKVKNLTALFFKNDTNICPKSSLYNPAATKVQIVISASLLGETKLIYSE